MGNANSSDNGNGWAEWKKLVLFQLERNTSEHRVLDRRVSEIQTDIAQLKTKAGVWGALAGAIPVLVALGLWLLNR